MAMANYNRKELELKNRTEGLTEEEATALRAIYKRRSWRALFFRLCFFAVGALLVTSGTVGIYHFRERGKLLAEQAQKEFRAGSEQKLHNTLMEIHGNDRNIGFSIVAIPVGLSILVMALPKYGLYNREAVIRTAEQLIAENNAREQTKQREGAKRQEGFRKVVQVLDVVEDIFGAAARGQATAKEKNTRAILPAQIYDRMQQGKLAGEARSEYVAANRQYIQSISEQITQWHQEGFNIAGALQKAQSTGLVSEPHCIDVAQLQGAVNETVDELWRDLNQAQRKETKPQLSDRERIEAVDQKEELIQQKLRKWREQNAPTPDLSRCALLSVWQDDWKKGREPAEYLPMFEAYQEFEYKLRNSSA